jgi:hypothetical protein
MLFHFDQVVVRFELSEAGELSTGTARARFPLGSQTAARCRPTSWNGAIKRMFQRQRPKYGLEQKAVNTIVGIFLPATFQGPAILPPSSLSLECCPAPAPTRWPGNRRLATLLPPTSPPLSPGRHPGSPGAASQLRQLRQRPACPERVGGALYASCYGGVTVELRWSYGGVTVGSRGFGTSSLSASRPEVKALSASRLNSPPGSGTFAPAIRKDDPCAASVAGHRDPRGLNYDID